MRHVGGRKIRLLVAVGMLAIGIAAMSQASSAATGAGRGEDRDLHRLQGRVCVRLRDWTSAARMRRSRSSPAPGRRTRTSRRPASSAATPVALASTFTDYACGDDTPGTILKEIRRLMVQQDADVMVGPLSGDEAVATANWAKSHLDKTIIIGTAGFAGPDDADRSEERVPLLRRRRAVERRHRRDPLQEVGLAKRRGDHGRLQLRVDVRGRLHRRLLCGRRQDHEACVPAAEHDRLLLVRPAAAFA